MAERNGQQSEKLMTGFTSMEAENKSITLRAVGDFSPSMVLQMKLSELPPQLRDVPWLCQTACAVFMDPQGQIQGPWSGLEMHDWYKAALFHKDLSVKMLEDAEFESLEQMVRRIGNSHEPFLVPQIGVPHGPASNPSGAPFTPVTAGVFPSFGTTLTVEQQNNLERRKQEEQYLMARHREFLAQEQATRQRVVLMHDLSVL